MATIWVQCEHHLCPHARQSLGPAVKLRIFFILAVFEVVSRNTFFSFVPFFSLWFVLLFLSIPLPFFAFWFHFVVHGFHSLWFGFRKGTSQSLKVFCFALGLYIIRGFYVLYSFSKSSLKTQALEAWHTAGGGFTCKTIFSGTLMVEEKVFTKGQNKITRCKIISVRDFSSPQLCKLIQILPKWGMHKERTIGEIMFLCHWRICHWRTCYTRLN